MKEQCWAFMGCGREPGGHRAAALGVCPACTAVGHHGRNGGLNGGRACWRVAGTCCGAGVRGTWAQRLMNCVRCDFFLEVREDEGPRFLL